MYKECNRLRNNLSLKQNYKIKKMKTGRIILLMASLVLTIASCWHDHDYYKVYGRGDYNTEEREVRTFTQIKSEIVADIHITQDNRHSVEISAQENILDVIETRVVGRELVIEYSVRRVEHDGVDIYISMETLEEISISGVGNVNNENTIETDNLKIEISGVGDVDFSSIIADEIKIESSGTGKVYLEGPAVVGNIDIELSGVGNVNTVNLEAESVYIHSSGTGNCRVNVINNLDVDISGLGNVYYTGDPDISSHISGFGKIKELE